MNQALIITNLCLGSFRPYSAMSCDNPHAVAESILEIYKYFDMIFVVNDEHQKTDKEFETLPRHMIIGSEDIIRMDYIEKELSKKPFQFLKKNNANALWSNHNNMIIEASCCKNFCVSGFTASYDVLYTVEGLKEEGKNVLIIDECIGDLSIDMKNDALSHLRNININVLNKKVFLERVKNDLEIFHNHL